jgi:hypothetical protein
MLDVSSLQHELLPQLRDLLIQTLGLINEETCSEDQLDALHSIEDGFQRSILIICEEVENGTGALTTLHAELHNALSRSVGVAYLAVTDPAMLGWDDDQRAQLAYIHQAAAQIYGRL